MYELLYVIAEKGGTSLSIIQGRRKMIKIRGLEHVHQWCKLPLEDHRAITPRTFFNPAISFCILGSDLPRILRKYYDYNPHRYISKRSYSMIQLESRKIQSSSAICIRSALSTLITYPIHL